MKNRIVFLLLIIFFNSCSGIKDKEEIENLLKYNFNEYSTLEKKINDTAGQEGKITYYLPKEQPTNKNFRRLSVKIEKNQISAEYCFMIDKSANVTNWETLIFDNKYKFIFNDKGNKKEGKDIWAKYVKWDSGDDNWADFLYNFLNPQFIILDN